MFRKPLSANTPMIHSRVARLGAVFQLTIPDSAVSAKMRVHAGPNSQSGGCHDGLRRSQYQGPRSVIVAPSAATNAAARAPATKGIHCRARGALTA